LLPKADASHTADWDSSSWSVGHWVLTGSGWEGLLGLHSHLMKCGLQPNLAGHASGIPGEVVIRCTPWD